MEILNVKPYHKGAMRAFVDVYIPKTGMEFYGCGLFCKDNKWWVSLPSKEFANESGERKFSQIARFREKEHQFAWSDALVKLVHQYAAEKNISLHEEQQQENDFVEDQNLPF